MTCSYPILCLSPYLKPRHVHRGVFKCAKPLYSSFQSPSQHLLLFWSCVYVLMKHTKTHSTCTHPMDGKVISSSIYIYVHTYTIRKYVQNRMYFWIIILIFTSEIYHVKYTYIETRETCGKIHKDTGIMYLGNVAIPHMTFSNFFLIWYTLV